MKVSTYLVRDIRNGKLYAMKVISKASVEKSNKVKQIISEKKIMEKMNHPFIIKLHSAFQTVSNNIESQIAFRNGFMPWR
jgi:serine/threonine protein kinase